jgi:hypothetical protein
MGLRYSEEKQYGIGFDRLCAFPGVKYTLDDIIDGTFAQSYFSLGVTVE